jgi:hypothetical protein
MDLSCETLDPQENNSVLPFAVFVNSRHESFVGRTLIGIKLSQAHRFGVTVHETEVATLIVACVWPGVRVVINIRGRGNHFQSVRPLRLEIVLCAKIAQQHGGGRLL